MSDDGAAPPDIPSASDMRDAAQAAGWAKIADERRPARSTFIPLIVETAVAHLPAAGTVLEPGSGPGFIARKILERRNDVRCTLVDWSDAMHGLAREHLGTLASRASFITANLKDSGWESGIGRFDVVLTLQTVHELRHKRHAPGFHRAVRNLLAPGGCYLVCDPYAGPGGMDDRHLFMTIDEQIDALNAGGFTACDILLKSDGLVLIEAR